MQLLPASTITEFTITEFLKHYFHALRKAHDAPYNVTFQITHQH